MDDILAVERTDEQVRGVVCRSLHWRYGYLVRPPVLAPFGGSWEYQVRDAHGARAIVRAWRGFSIVPRSARSIPPDAVERLFVFSPTGTYGGAPDPLVTVIPYEEITEFIDLNPNALPAILRRVLRTLWHEQQVRVGIDRTQRE